MSARLRPFVPTHRPDGIPYTTKKLKRGVGPRVAQRGDLPPTHNSIPRPSGTSKPIPWRLLKKYRDVVWSMELSVLQIKREFEYESTIEEFLDSIYLAGADLSGTDIENHARCIERSRRMLSLLRNAVEFLRTRHKNGETFYWILFYTYLLPQRFQDVNEIIEQLRPHLRDISVPTYYRRRKKAVETLSSILWGYTSQDCMKIMEDFFPSE